MHIGLGGMNDFSFNTYTTNMKSSLVVVLVACAVAGVSGWSNSSARELNAQEFTFTVLHTNDVHGRIEQFNKYGTPCSRHANRSPCYGGVARRHTKVADIRKTHDNVLLVDAGDQYQGTLWFVKYRGSAALHFMNMLKYDVMTLGNHEFDLGIEGIVPFLENVSFPVVNTNIDISKETRLTGLFNRSVVLPVDDHMVGIIGVITQTTGSLVNPDGVTNLKFNDEIQAVREEVDRLKSMGIKIIILLSHSGFDVDKQLASQVDGLDLIIGGHSHTFLYTGTPPTKDIPVDTYPTWVAGPSGKNVPIVQDYAHGKFLGYLNVTFNSKGELIRAVGNPILLDESISEDPAVLEEVEQWRAPLINISSTQMGTSYVLLDGSREVCRLQECNMGNLVTDAILFNVMTPPSDEAWTDISISIWNGGGIRNSADKGDVTLGDLLSVLPFRNTISVITVKGKGLVQILEFSISRYNPKDALGGFLQVSGLRVQYNLHKPVGSRVVKVDVKCSKCSLPSFSPLEMEREYDVAISDFLISGGDGYTMIKKIMLRIRALNMLAVTSLAKYCKTRTPLIVGLEGRITFLQDTSGAPPVSAGSILLLLPILVAAVCTKHTL